MTLRRHYVSAVAAQTALSSSLWEYHIFLYLVLPSTSLLVCVGTSVRRNFCTSSSSFPERGRPSISDDQRRDDKHVGSVTFRLQTRGQGQLSARGPEDRQARGLSGRTNGRPTQEAAKFESCVLVSEWPRASRSSSHVGGMSGHVPNSPVALGGACWWLSLVWLGARAPGLGVWRWLVGLWLRFPFFFARAPTRRPAGI